MIVYDDDGVPLPPEPDEPDDGYPEIEPDDEVCTDCERDPDDCPLHTLRDEDDEDAPPVPLAGEASREVAERHARVRELARRVHVAPPPPSGLYLRLGGEFDPRGRHVGCDGDADGARGCGAAPGVACSPPGRRFIPGFVHPSRLAAERTLFGVDESPVAV